MWDSDKWSQRGSVDSMRKSLVYLVEFWLNPKAAKNTLKDFNGGAVCTLERGKTVVMNTKKWWDLKKKKNLLILSEAVNAKGTKENSKDKVREKGFKRYF